MVPLLLFAAVSVMVGACAEDAAAPALSDACRTDVRVLVDMVGANYELTASSGDLYWIQSGTSAEAAYAIRWQRDSGISTYATLPPNIFAGIGHDPMWYWSNRWLLDSSHPEEVWAFDRASRAAKIAHLGAHQNARFAVASGGDIWFAVDDGTASTTLQRVPDGHDAVDRVVAAPSGSMTIAVDGQRVLFFSIEGLFSYDPVTGDVIHLASNAPGIGVTLDNHQLYAFGTSPEGAFGVLSWNLSGGEPSFVGEAANTTGLGDIATNSTTVFWSDSICQPSENEICAQNRTFGRIMAAPKSGGPARVICAGEIEPFSLAADDDDLFFFDRYQHLVQLGLQGK